MVTLSALVLPIILSAVFVFIASSVIHMALKYHNSDYRKLPNEDGVRAVIRQASPLPGQYILPWCTHGKDQSRDEINRKFSEGPNGVLWLRPTGLPNMGAHLGKWIVFCLAISLFAGYLASHTLLKSAHYLEVFRIVGTVAFLGYAGSNWADVIWKGKPVSCALKDSFDGLIYGLVTAGTFGWLWPR